MGLSYTDAGSYAKRVDPTTSNDEQACQAVRATVKDDLLLSTNALLL
jgi:hypothetical protein